MGKLQSLLSCLLAVQILVGCVTAVQEPENNGEINLNRIPKEGAKPILSISGEELTSRVSKQWSGNSFEMVKTSTFEQKQVFSILKMFVVDASFAQYMHPKLTDGCEYFDLVDIKDFEEQESRELGEQWTVKMCSRTENYKITFPESHLRIVRI